MGDETIAYADDLNYDPELALGHVRDDLLNGIKRHIEWDKLPEKKQIALNEEVEFRARQAIKEVVRVVHGHGFQTIPVTVSSLKEAKEGQLEAKLSCEGTDDNVLGIYRAGRCSLVLADPSIFMGAKPAPVMKDQPDLIEDAAQETDAEAEQMERNGALIEQGIKPLDAEPEPEPEAPPSKPKRHRRTVEERVAENAAAVEMAEAD